MPKSTGSKLADHLTRVVADAKRLGYSDAQAKAMAKEEAEKHGTYDIAVAADATARALRA